MLYSLTIKDPADLPIPWWSKVKSLEGVKKLSFKPGLNILWGRNGSGKSTVLTLVARSFHAEQGGHSIVTHESARAVFRDGLGLRTGATGSDPMFTGATFKHDGKPIFYANPNTVIGLMGGGAAFDDDFLVEGVQAMLHKGSAGETTIYRTNVALRGIGTLVKEIIYKAGGNEVWQRREQKIRKSLKANAESGPYTVLLDEPDRSLDLDRVVRLWQGIPSVADKYQMIVATHSPYALRVEGANYVELTPGYLDACRKTWETA